MKITVYKGDKCEILSNGNYRRISDSEIVYKKPKTFGVIAIGKGGKIK